ncbi:MAG: hypothetical protein AB7G23_16665 [Vicinamibacterales bacterium]
MRLRTVVTQIAPMFVGTAAVALMLAVPGASAQGRGGQGGPPPTPQAAAPIDLTGNWVSIVNEDWRWRMVTPPKGDYASVPLNDAGREMADTWTEDQDGSCKAYGVGGLMRQPTRLRVSWQDPNTVKIETDAGQQTRMLHFNAAAASGPRSLQGNSVAMWEQPARQGRGANATQPPGGTLKVETTNVAAGWLRRNGVPYSENAKITEYFDRFPSPNGDEWLVVTTIVDDPMYLNQPFITSSHFKREPDGSKWSPAACK